MFIHDGIDRLFYPHFSDLSGVLISIKIAFCHVIRICGSNPGHDVSPSFPRQRDKAQHVSWKTMKISNFAIVGVWITFGLNDHHDPGTTAFHLWSNPTSTLRNHCVNPAGQILSWRKQGRLKAQRRRWIGTQPLQRPYLYFACTQHYQLPARCMLDLC